MLYKPTIVLPGVIQGVRVDSRDLEANLQKAVQNGHRCIEIHAYGQHGIGGPPRVRGAPPIKKPLRGA
jgi:hypothetical protein